MRTFISIDANDYFGSGDPSGRVIPIATEGNEGLLKAIIDHVGLTDENDFNDWLEEYQEEGGIPLNPSIEDLIAHFVQQPVGDGESMKFLFEMKPDNTMELVLGSYDE